MEGFGSRQSRAASRYGSSPAPAPVFNGPVRKWKKQWVSTQPNNGNGNDDGRKSAPPLLLCRWTPLSATASADEPPKRRLRYAPVVPIEKGSKEDLKEVVSNETGASKLNLSYSDTNLTSIMDGISRKPSTGDISGEETQELSEDQSNSNRSLGRGSCTPGSTQNDSNGGRMLINWED